MVIFNSYVKLPEGKSNIFSRTFPGTRLVVRVLRRWRQEDVAGHLPGDSPVDGMGTSCWESIIKPSADETKPIELIMVNSG